MGYLQDSRFHNLCSLLKLYIQNGKIDKYQLLVQSLPKTNISLTGNRLELIYALADSSKYLAGGEPSAPLVDTLKDTFLHLISAVSRNQVVFASESPVNHYFQLTYYLVNTVISLPEEVTKDHLETSNILYENLGFISNELTSSSVDDSVKLVYYFILFGYLFAFTHRSLFLISDINNEDDSVTSMRLFNFLTSIVENHSFLNQLESIIANSLVISLNDSVANFNTSTNANYKLLYNFNLQFPKFIGKKSKSTEFSSLLFLKYLNLVKLNLILAVSKIPLSSQDGSIVESLVCLRSKEIEEPENQNNEVDDIEDLDVESSISLSGVSSASTVSYISRFSQTEKNLFLQFSTQSLNQLHTFQNGASFIILSSLDRINLIFENKSLILEIFSCLYFLNLVNYEFIYNNLLSKNLIINYSASTNYSSLVTDADNVSISGNSYLGNSIPSLVPTSGSNYNELIDNNELIHPSLSFNIFGLLALVSMASKKMVGSLYDNNLSELINKKISFLIFNNPKVSFSKVLKKSLRCIALAYRHSSQDHIVGLIYSLINMLSVDNEEENVADPPHNGVFSRSLAGTLRAPRLTRTDIMRSTVNGEGGNGKTIANDEASYNASFNNTASVIQAPNHNKNDASFGQIKNIFANSINSIIELTNNYNQEEITVLVITILAQKFNISQKSTISGTADVTELLNYLITSNLYKLTYSLHNNSKTFQLLVKTYSNLLTYVTNNEEWKLADVVITAYCKMAKVLKESFYLIEKDTKNPGAGYIKLPSVSNGLALSFYDTDKRLIYDLTNSKVNENYKILLHELLNSVISKGDNLNKLEDNSHHRSHTEISEVAKKIEVYLKPLAMLLPSPYENQSALVFSSYSADTEGKNRQEAIDEVSVNLFRNIWFNMIVHGMNIDLLPYIIPSLKNSSSIDMPKLNKTKKESTGYQRKLIRYLQIIAYNSPPLASKLSWSHNENLLELNTVLRRGSSHSNTRFQKSVLETILDNDTTSSVGSLEKSLIATNDVQTPFKGKISSTPKLMFLAATIFLEFLRIESGDFFKVLLYFSDPSIKLSNLEKDMKCIVFELLTSYLRKIDKNINSINQITKHTPASKTNLPLINNFTINHIARQLNEMLTLTCATNGFLQGISIKCCDLLINQLPNVLCHQESLFKMLDLMNLLFTSIVNYEKLKYNPVLEYNLPNYSLNQVTNTHDITSFEKILLLDSLEWRQATFEKLQLMAKEWILTCLRSSSQIMKNLLQNYVVINSNISSTANNQLYSTIKHYKSDSSINFAVSFAIQMGKTIMSTDKEIYHVVNSTSLGGSVSTADTLSDLLINYNINADLSNVRAEYNITKHAIKLRHAVNQLYVDISHGEGGSRNNEIVTLVDDIASFLSLVKNIKHNRKALEVEFTRYLIEIPFKIFNCDILKYCISHWFIISANNVKLQFFIINEILRNFQETILENKGLFNRHNTGFLPEYKPMEYAPSNKQENDHFASIASEMFKIHLLLIRLIHSFFHSTLYQSNNLLRNFNEFVMFVLRNFSKINNHPFTRLLRFEFIKLSLDVLTRNLQLKGGGQKLFSNLNEYNFFHVFVSLILDASLNWFKYRKIPPFSDNLLKIKTDYNLLLEIADSVSKLNLTGDNILAVKKKLLLVFLNDEITSISVWLNPLGNNAVKDFRFNASLDRKLLLETYLLDPALAINVVTRVDDAYKGILKQILLADPLVAINCPNALSILLDPELYTTDKHLLTNGTPNSPLKYLLYWDPVSPIDSINLFLPPFGKNPYILQYAMRSLTAHDINVTFFYVPQIVQMLRFDVEGYVRKFILETAQVSQLFAHQIIWNMLANSYKDDEGTIPDGLKPKLDEIRNLMTKSFSPEDYDYYQKEFSFFKEITGISGKLKPYIKKTKAEKKLKIDEEMRKITLEPGVYLPSNPDGTLVDINRTSGKPLQSHAKAPFMATFKISRKQHFYQDDEPDNTEENNTVVVETWQSAIFKVGDDCRQDVLALQLISVFRSIWANNNMDLYVFPYRVTATDAGCGIIDVLPNSVSRDMLGREAVNGLYEYFITKFGPEYSTEFQIARNNLIKSLAAYSIISYLLQFKDRHNGNIMYDDQGHILHIDFGFCFDIVPGGVKFEAVPFKLTKEMVMVMGGSNETQSFKRFEELCVLGYLAVRPYMDTIVKCVLPMLESGLPCFKGMTTIKNLKARFVPGKTEKEAALFMRKLVRKSYESYFTKGYDEFQRLTNGIPY